MRMRRNVCLISKMCVRVLSVSVKKSASLRAWKIKCDFLCRVYENSGDTWGKNISIHRSSALT